MAEYALRLGTLADVSGIVPLWLLSYRRSREARTEFPGKEHNRAYWAKYEPRFHRILASSATVIACDPEDPSVIWGFSVLDGRTVHYVLCKRRFHRLGITAHMFTAMLGERMQLACTYTHELVEFRRQEIVASGLIIPESWVHVPWSEEKAA